MRDIYSLLQKYFGYTSFRPLQEEIIRDVLGGQDVLAIMPTGCGKSLCYQIPALAHPHGLTIIISPLIALMKDQVDTLQHNGIHASYLNSSLTPTQQDEIMQQLQQEKVPLLYVAPERLMQNRFLQFLKQLKINIFAIDEAHCISAWGHDFRPEYRELRKLREEFPLVPIIALTATATTQVKQDILQQLKLSEGKVYQASFDRPNLTYSVKQKNDTVQQILTYLKEHAGDSGIIYCHSRDGVNTLADILQKENIRVLPYHAGLTDEERRTNQEQFIRDDVSVMVATVAFGMGIDKPNVRFIMHYDIPANLERYYQETGRAGRDGLPSECILFYSYGDKRKIEYFIREKTDEQQQEIAKQQLQHLIDFATFSKCRRKALLKYFGDTYTEENCQSCDNCLTVKERFDGTVVAQKILSCIYRVNQRFGSRHVASILLGEKSQRITELRHDLLSTYGILPEYSLEQIQDLIRQLVDNEYVRIESDPYPILKLTSKSRLILHGNEQILLNIPIKKEKKQKKMKQRRVFEGINGELFEKLRVLRKSIADTQHVPPYIIFSDATLGEMTRALPKTKDAFRKISGVGEHKLNLYAEAFLREIASYHKEVTVYNQQEVNKH